MPEKDVLLTRFPQLRYRFEIFPLASIIPTSRSSSCFRALDGFFRASSNSLGDHTSLAACRPISSRTDPWGFRRSLVFAIASILPYRPHGRNAVRFPDTQLYVRSLEDAAAVPHARNSHTGNEHRPAALHATIRLFENSIEPIEDGAIEILVVVGVPWVAAGPPRGATVRGRGATHATTRRCSDREDPGTTPIERVPRQRQRGRRSAA